MRKGKSFGLKKPTNIQLLGACQCTVADTMQDINFEGQLTQLFRQLDEQMSNTGIALLRNLPPSSESLFTSMIGYVSTAYKEFYSLRVLGFSANDVQLSVKGEEGAARLASKPSSM